MAGLLGFFTLISILALVIVSCGIFTHEEWGWKKKVTWGVMALTGAAALVIFAAPPLFEAASRMKHESDRAKKEATELIVQRVEEIDMRPEGEKAVTFGRDHTDSHVRVWVIPNQNEFCTLRLDAEKHDGRWRIGVIMRNRFVPLDKDAELREKYVTRECAKQ